MRSIDTAGFADITVPEDFGPAPQLQWIAVADLVVDDGYQRPTTGQESRRNIRRIARAFNWRQFAPVIVSPVEGGGFAIIDGQHRTTAASLCGIERVPCLVVLATRREQAEAFKAINGNVTQVSRQAIFKASLASGDLEARRIEDVATAAGVRILFSNRDSRNRKTNETTALIVITKGIRDHGDATVTTALRGILAASGDGPCILFADIIGAVVEVLGAHPEWRDHPGLMKALEGIDFATSRTDAAVAARKAPGTTASLHLQADLTTALDTLLPTSARQAAE